MYSRYWIFQRISLVLVLVSLGSSAGSGRAFQQMKIERFFPSQLLRGQSTVITLAAKGLDAIQSVEISPSPGVTVTGIKPDTLKTEEDRQAGGLKWWELTVEVAKDAATGKRDIVLVTPGGRTAPQTVVIPSHVPSISKLTIVSTSPRIELRISAFDEFGDLGNTVWLHYKIGCGGGFVSGISDAKVSAQDKRNSVINASITRPSASGKCNLEVRLIEISSGINSNTLETTIDFKN